MDKIIAVLKNAWSFAKEKKIYFIVIGVIVGVSSGWFKVMIMKTAYEHQEKQSEKREVSFKKQINALQSTLSATKKTVKKYKVLAGKECDCEPKKYEEIVYENIKETSSDGTKTETNTDIKTEDKSKVKLPNQDKPLHIGGGGDVYTEAEYKFVYVELGYTFFNTAYGEIQYITNLKGSYSVRAGGGLRF